MTERERIGAGLQEYLASGKKIKVVPPGASGDRASRWLQRPIDAKRPYGRRRADA